MSAERVIPDFDPTKPIVELNITRGCPECFNPVEFVRTDHDRSGLYEVWRCTKPSELQHSRCEDPTHHHQRGDPDRRCHEASHQERSGLYVVRESHYRRSFSRRGSVLRRKSRQQKKAKAS